MNSNRNDNNLDAPEVVILRLPQYVRALGALLDRHVHVVSSAQLGDHLQMTPAQIRKDLSYFGRFGKQGRGYPVKYLLTELRQVLGLDDKWNTILVGVGRLGTAIIEYPGFTPEGFNIVAAFDSDTNQIGSSVGSLTIQGLSDLSLTIRNLNVSIAIVAVPARHAQVVIDSLVEYGIRAVLNYAPIGAQVPDHVKIRNVDPIISLQSMSYYLKQSKL
tara:strand:+ start:634 stop:1284 length:651 start_codon:yes stop_codon:yes gene_type:complete